MKIVTIAIHRRMVCRLRNKRGQVAGEEADHFLLV